MKIKVVYGVDMRLWKKVDTAKPETSLYEELLSYICQTFGFDDIKQFRVTFEDDDDTKTTIASVPDLEDAFNLAQKAQKKSLKLYITDSAEQHHQTNNDQKDDEKAADKPQQNDQNDQNDPNSSPPSPEQLNAFLSDDLVIDLLSDLLVSVFEALQASNFEISFMDTIHAVILSSNDKYDKITSNPIWPYFMNEILAKKAAKINAFVIPMMQMNGGINPEMIKQWVPNLLSMMKMRAQNGGFNGFGWRGRGRRGCRGKRGRGRRGWRGHRGHHHGHHHHHRGRGHRGCHRGGRWGQNVWFGQQQNNDDGMFEGRWDGEVQPNAAPAANGRTEDDQIEQEAFEYTEELVAIMNMGFGPLWKIKKLLNEHKGNKQNVVQELVASK